VSGEVTGLIPHKMSQYGAQLQHTGIKITDGVIGSSSGVRYLCRKSEKSIGSFSSLFGGESGHSLGVIGGELLKLCWGIELSAVGSVYTTGLSGLSTNFFFRRN
jgi:hypothetical protein